MPEHNLASACAVLGMREKKLKWCELLLRPACGLGPKVRITLGNPTVLWTKKAGKPPLIRL